MTAAKLSSRSYSVCCALPVLQSRRAGARPLREKRRTNRQKLRRLAHPLARVPKRPRISCTATTSTSAPAASANAVVYYGSWLDDASMVSPGDVWVGLATGYWRGESNSQIDAPVVERRRRYLCRVCRRVAVRRSTISATLTGFQKTDSAVSRSTESFSSPIRCAPRAIGVAVTPLLEFSPGSEAPVGWALPVNLEARRGDCAHLRVGGLLFARIGVRNRWRGYPASPRACFINGTFGQSYARAGTHQTSLGVGASLGLTATSGLFVGLGQTFAPRPSDLAESRSPAGCRSSFQSQKTLNRTGYTLRQAGEPLSSPPSNHVYLPVGIMRLLF